MGAQAQSERKVKSNMMYQEQPNYAEFRAGQMLALLKWRPYIDKINWRYKTMRTFDDVARDVEAGRMIFVYNDNAYALLYIDQRTLGKIVHIWQAGGSPQGLGQLEEGIINLARSVDARQITALGRRGFKKWQHGTLKATGQRQFTMEL